MLSLLLGFVVGSVLGSFSEATADRISNNRTVLGRSYCERCKKTLGWYDLFPIVSFVLLWGRCRYCHKKIPLELFISEVAVAVLVALVFFFTLPRSFSWFDILSWMGGLTILTLVFNCFVVVCLTVLFLVDLKTGLLPDKVTLPAAAVALVYLLISSILKSWIFHQSFLKSPLAPYLMPPKSDYLYQHLLVIWQPTIWTLGVALALSGLFLLIIVITKGRGMGGGDVKYTLFLGLSLGFPKILVGVFSAFVLGSVVAIILIILGKKQFGQTIPFGPFLSLGSFVGLILGNQIISWYLNSFKI